MLDKLPKGMTMAERRRRKAFYDSLDEPLPEEDTGCQNCGYDNGTVKHRATVLGTLTYLCNSCAKLKGEDEGL
jgi:hypothetical protein